jgi:hypothetical protein
MSALGPMSETAPSIQPQGVEPIPGRASAEPAPGRASQEERSRVRRAQAGM